MLKIGAAWSSAHFLEINQMHNESIRQDVNGAQANVGEKATRNNAKTPQPDPCHRAHSWFSDRVVLGPGAIFAAQAMDVARGTKVIAQVLHQHLTDLSALGHRTNAIRTLFSENDTEALAGLMVFSLDALYQLASEAVDLVNDQAERGVQA